MVWPGPTALIFAILQRIRLLPMALASDAASDYSVAMSRPIVSRFHLKPSPANKEQ